MDRFDPFVKYADVYGDIINWEKDPMNKPQNQNKYFFSDGKTYYEQICKMLRLMSVFKEAFNQIYSNEDEISEAWENFVNNLSASVVEGSEPDVTLTWTDDSVNFEFTMVPGVPGEQGVGITSISFNSDYTMTITLSDGNTYTSMSLKGETGPQGPQGETGSGLQILDVYASLADLQSAHPTGQPGDAYQVGSGGSYTLYIWSSSQSAWIPAGSLGTVSPSTSNPLMDGTASAGSSDLYSRGDHVHPSDTSRASQEELDELIKTSQTLIDQSFTYRESPAIQDGLARIDKIKGNTLVWNQLVQNGNFSAIIPWSINSGGTLAVANNEGSITLTSAPSNSYLPNLRQAMNNGFVQNHKYLFLFDVYLPHQSYMRVEFGGGGFGETTGSQLSANIWHRVSIIKVRENAPTNNLLLLYPPYATGMWSANDVWKIRNVNVFDLTQMGLDSITSVDEFISLFPLPYYDYNAGSLLSFNGSGLKTVGFNQWDEEWKLGNINVTTGKFEYANDMFCSKNFIPVLPETDYFIINPNQSSLKTRFYDASMNYIGHNDYNGTSSIPAGGRVFKTPSNCCYFKFGTQSGEDVYNNNICLNISNPARNGEYEAYTEKTSDLPTLTYFPNGIKSAGTAYDELAPTKAITRIGVIDLGTLDWRHRGEVQAGVFSCDVTSVIPYKRQPSVNFEIATYENGGTVTGVYAMAEKNNMTVALYYSTDNTSKFIYAKNTAYTDGTAFKNAMSGIYLYYELETPVETAVDLDFDFMAYENGTEQLLPVNGSDPATSPIIADMTYMSIDDAMEYIIDKIANVPQNTQQILESLENDVTDLQTDVGALQPAVSALQTSVGNINTNIGQISSTVAGHTASISDMQSDITDLNTDLGDLSDTVTDNTSRIGTLESGLSATNGNVQNLETSISDLDDTVTAQGTTVTALDDIIQDISNNPVVASLGSHELGFVAAYVSATLPANTGTRVTIPKPTIFPNNYTPLFIVGMSTGSYNVSICEIPPTFGSSNSVNCRVWNHGSEQTTQITVYILCMRQRQSQ